jgi:predicted  nucleic acid-binding Zn-ribbon protein
MLMNQLLQIQELEVLLADKNKEIPQIEEKHQARNNECEGLEKSISQLSMEAEKLKEVMELVILLISIQTLPHWYK